MIRIRYWSWSWSWSWRQESEPEWVLESEPESRSGVDKSLSMALSIVPKNCFEKSFLGPSGWCWMLRLLMHCC